MPALKASPDDAKYQNRAKLGVKIPNKLIDELNIKIMRELIGNPRISSTDIAGKYHVPLSTIQRRRAKLEKHVISPRYNLDIRRMGWRTADLLITVQKGKAEETAQELLQNDSVISSSLRIGDPRVDIMAEVFYRDSIELHGLTEKVKAMPFVSAVEWAEVVKIVGANNISTLEYVFRKIE